MFTNNNNNNLPFDIPQQRMPSRKRTGSYGNNPQRSVKRFDGVDEEHETIQPAEPRIPHYTSEADVAALEQSVFPDTDHCKSFSVAWLLRVLYYKYGKFASVSRTEINQCIHPGLRPPTGTRGFGIDWIWRTVQRLTAREAPVRLVRWVWKNKSENEIHNPWLEEGELMPDHIALTEDGRRAAMALGQNKTHPLSLKEPPADRRYSLADAIGSAGFMVEMDGDDDANDQVLLLNEGTSVNDVARCMRKWLRELVVLRKRVSELEEELRQARAANEEQKNSAQVNFYPQPVPQAHLDVSHLPVEHHMPQEMRNPEDLQNQVMVHQPEPIMQQTHVMHHQELNLNTQNQGLDQ